MANFKFVVSEPETKNSYQIEVDQNKAAEVLGKKIGDEVRGDPLGLTGYTLKITGGTDRDGFPMLSDINGPGARRILLTGTPGYHPKMKGQRKRKRVRGNTISQDIIQINTKIVKRGEKTLAEITGKGPKKEEPKKTEEQKPEPKKEEKKEEPKETKHETKQEKPKEEKPVEQKQETKKEEPKKTEAPEPKQEEKKEEKVEQKTEQPKPEEKKEEPKTEQKDGGEKTQTENEGTNKS